MTEAAGAETVGARARGSIARRMLIATAASTAIVLALAAWTLGAFYQSETERQLDRETSGTILTLANAVDSDPTGGLVLDETKFPLDDNFEKSLSGWYWAVITVDSQQEIQTARRSNSFADAGPQPTAQTIEKAISRPGVEVHENGPGPNDKLLHINVMAVKLPDRVLPILLYASVDRTSADATVSQFTLRLGLMLGVLAIIIIVGALVLIRYGLRPLHEIEGKLHDVRSGRRDTLDGEYPTELLPLVKEINTLISHNRNVVQRARTHVGNLAHALKTPLAVLMNEARGNKDRISETVRRQAEAMTSNVNHYLKRAQAAAQAEVLGARTEIREPIEGIARMLERLHREKNITVDVDADPRAVFRGEKGDLDELVGNLLENAAKWCKSRVKVKATRSDDGIQIIVDDDGPGLPAEHRAKALERGKRLDESEPGTGLGLSIVTELADIYGGRLHLEDSPMGGLRARLELPAAPL